MLGESDWVEILMQIPQSHTQKLGFGSGGWDQNLPLICTPSGSNAASPILALGSRRADETQCQAALMYNEPQPETLGVGEKAA